MRPSEHIAFARFVAMQAYIEEVNRRRLPQDLSSTLLAIGASKLIGDNIGTLPDYLEPGLNIYHRKIFHSKDAFRLIEQWKNELRSRPSNNNPMIEIGLIMALSAYQSHILLDSQTPMGVPDYSWVLQLLNSFKRT
jgi:hypothetical protein